MRDTQQTLTRKQQSVIGALLSQPTIEKSAKLSGVSAPTIYRWLKNPEFKREYVLAKWQVVSQAIGQLQEASGLAVNTLRRVMEDPVAPAACKISAARTILDMGLRGLEMEDLESRLTSLERYQKNDNPFLEFTPETP
jgi:hypothetical protein